MSPSIAGKYGCKTISAAVIIVSSETAMGSGCFKRLHMEVKSNEAVGIQVMLKHSRLRLISMTDPNAILSDVAV